MNHAFRVRTILLPAIVLGSMAQGASADITNTPLTLANFNVITAGNLSDSSDIQGRVVVGGTLMTNLNLGGQLSQSTNSSSINGYFSTVASGVSLSDNNLPATTFVYGTASGGSVSGATQATASQASYYNGALANYLTGLSTGYDHLTANSTATEGTGSNTNLYTFNLNPTTIGGKSVAVFNVSASLFTNSSNTLQLSTNPVAGETVVVNVIGSGSISISSGLGISNFVNANDSANIIFNFENATALTIGENLGASILAPDAALNTNGVSLKGGVYVNSIANVGEIDLATSSSGSALGFTGYVPATVPEPASLAMMLLGGGMAAGSAAVRRRRASKAVASV
jgi:choice-of-anchor A domain-containing protein